MNQLRFAVFGTGFWSRFQIAAWQEFEDAKCVAIYNRTRSRAEAAAKKFGVASVYDDPEVLLQNEQLDFIDIISDVSTHSWLVSLAAKYRVPVICQKPMADQLVVAEQMVATCQQADIPFMIHENWRWQFSVREFKKALEVSGVGRPFRAHILYANSFPVFDNQPFLKELEKFILTDIGSHILDTARFLFGDAKSLYCQTHCVTPGIKGEDVATVMMVMGQSTTVTCSMSYASRVEHDRFPETFIYAECENGSVELGPDFWIKTTTKDGTLARRFPPPRYKWADPAYDIVHASIVTCNGSLLDALKNRQPAETDGADNLKTMRLVFGAYDSARTGRVIHFQENNPSQTR